MTIEEFKEIPLNTNILIKYEEEYDKGFYVVRKESNSPDYYGNYCFVEAEGEGYGEYDISIVKDWVSFEELDKFFELRSQNGIHGKLEQMKGE